MCLTLGDEPALAWARPLLGGRCRRGRNWLRSSEHRSLQLRERGKAAFAGAPACPPAEVQDAALVPALPPGLESLSLCLSHAPIGGMHAGLYVGIDYSSSHVKSG